MWLTRPDALRSSSYLPTANQGARSSTELVFLLGLLFLCLHLPSLDLPVIEYRTYVLSLKPKPGKHTKRTVCFRSWQASFSSTPTPSESSYNSVRCSRRALASIESCNRTLFGALDILLAGEYNAYELTPVLVLADKAAFVALPRSAMVIPPCRPCDCECPQAALVAGPAARTPTMEQGLVFGLYKLPWTPSGNGVGRACPFCHRLCASLRGEWRVHSL